MRCVSFASKFIKGLAGGTAEFQFGGWGLSSPTLPPHPILGGLFIYLLKPPIYILSISGGSEVFLLLWFFFFPVPLLISSSLLFHQCNSK